MNYGELIPLTRDCDVTMIPYGAKMTLKKGDQIRITQALGGSFTILFNGNMFRIEEQDADAIGKESTVQYWEKNGNAEFSEKMVWDAMKTCYDPEIPVDIVDLGLIYSCQHFPLDNGGVRVEVKMTLTAPGCGMGGIIADEVKHKILGLPGVKDVDVELVWDPPWSQSMMSDAAKLHMGML